MFLKLAKQAGKSLSKDTALKVVTGVLVGAVPGMVGGWLPGRASRPGSPAGGQLQRWYKGGYECIQLTLDLAQASCSSRQRASYHARA
jgi:hypothetical protein